MPVVCVSAHAARCRCGCSSGWHLTQPSHSSLTSPLLCRCRISHNIHFSGAVMRVTDGLGPTSLRSSSFANNTATAVLRFEGRTWVLNTQTFFEGIQFLDVLFYTQFQGASKAAYNFAELQHAQQQVRQGQLSGSLPGCCLLCALGFEQASFGVCWGQLSLCIACSLAMLCKR